MDTKRRWNIIFKVAFLLLLLLTIVMIVLESLGKIHGDAMLTNIWLPMVLSMFAGMGWILNNQQH